MLAGSTQAFQFLKAETLKLSVDLTKQGKGARKFILTKDLLNVPPNLSVVGIEPAEITIVASRLVPVTVAIRIVTKNAPPPGQSVRTMYCVPDRVRLLVPRRAAQEKINVQTSPIDLGAISAPTTVVPAELVIPPDAQFAGGNPPVVRVVVKLGTKTAPTPRRRGAA